jgi:hypothetical protein
LPCASVTVAVATDVEVPSAGIDDELRVIVMPLAGPGVCVSDADPRTAVGAEPSVAVIVYVPAVVVARIVAWYVPGAEPRRIVPTCCPPELENVTPSPVAGPPSGSVTVAVATVVEEPSAPMEGRLRSTVTLVAGPPVCVNVARPDNPETELSVAVIVDAPAVVLVVTIA